MAPAVRMHPDGSILWQMNGDLGRQALRQRSEALDAAPIARVQEWLYLQVQGGCDFAVTV